MTCILQHAVVCWVTTGSQANNHPIIVRCIIKSDAHHFLINPPFTESKVDLIRNRCSINSCCSRRRGRTGEGDALLLRTTRKETRRRSGKWTRWRLGRELRWRSGRELRRCSQGRSGRCSSAIASAPVRDRDCEGMGNEICAPVRFAFGSSGQAGQAKLGLSWAGAWRT
jgi:hypothetical protein